MLAVTKRFHLESNSKERDREIRWSLALLGPGGEGLGVRSRGYPRLTAGSDLSSCLRPITRDKTEKNRDFKFDLIDDVFQHVTVLNASHLPVE